jgi:hypothetical protein
VSSNTILLELSGIEGECDMFLRNVDKYQAVQRKNTEGLHLQQNCCENTKSWDLKKLQADTNHLSFLLTNRLTLK